MENTALKKDYGLAELNKEATFGGMGREKARDVPQIDLSDFERRKGEIADQLKLLGLMGQVSVEIVEER